MRVIIGMTILIVVSILSLIIWHKYVDSLTELNTTWIYGIYVVIQLILGLFVLLALEQYWSVH